jgi:hypothetical protein
MPDVTFKFNGATITVREAIGQDALESPALIYELAHHLADARGVKLKEDGSIDVDKLPRADWASIQWFALAFQRSGVTGDLGFLWPDRKIYTGGEIFEAHENLMTSSYELVEQWRKALRSSNLETPDPED